ncbi:MAG: hypothetical protein CVU61_09065 [Deltaproteobacteria bacterium HGW-Deltaproteobacteria-19]|jgi:hypothetical protein|nr:MAG: hypothetical protein CVU61_09065 [Deltaproteobacteria bacterium HGW-Deltaproteobacteria-19]
MTTEQVQDREEDHVHLELDQVFEFISGSYSLVEEGRLPYKGREVLYAVGVASLDRSCCGSGGCRFLRVPGYLLRWQYRTGEAGRPVSRVEPILDESERTEIRRLLERAFPHSQVNFLP